MIRIRHYAYKPKGSDTYKIKYFRAGKYWFQEGTVHGDYDTADRLGRRRVTELELRDHHRALGIVELSRQPLADITAAFARHGRRKGGRRGNPWSEKYAHDLEEGLRWWWDATGWKVLEDINLAAAEAALDGKMDPRKRQPTSGSHKNNMMSFLQGLVKFAKKPLAGKEPLAPKSWNPLEDWEPYNDDPDKLFREFEVQEFQALMHHSESQEERLAYLMAAATRARFSALKGLKIFDADFAGARVRIDRRATGNKAKVETWKKVPRWIMEELGAQARGRDPGDVLLLGLVGHHGGKTIQRRLRAAGVPIRNAKGVLSFHSLKVMGVNLLWDQGADARTVQAMSDHSDLDLSARVYGRSRESAEWRATEGVGEWLRQALSNDGDTEQTQFAEESMQAGTGVVGAAGFEPAAAGEGKDRNPRASLGKLIPFKNQDGAGKPPPQLAYAGIPGPAGESRLRHTLAIQFAEIWPHLDIEAQQSLVNHARGWLAGLLPNRHRKSGST